MSSKNLVTFAVALATLAWTPPARADSNTWQATGSGEVGYTSSPSGLDINRDSRMFATIRPGVLYAVNGPHLVLEGTLQAEIVENLFPGDHTPSILGRGGLRANWLTGPRSTLTLGLNADKGLMSLLSSRTTSDQTDPALMPVGQVSIWHADADEGFSYQWSKSTHLSQGSAARYSATDDGIGTQNDTREASFSLGIEREFDRDTIGLESSVNFLRLKRITPPGGLLSSRQNDQLGPRGTATWQRYLGARWSVGANGGAVMLIPMGDDTFHPTETRKGGIFPVGGGQLAYSGAWGSTVLSVGRDIVPNPFLSQNTVGDSARVRMAMPLPWLGTRKDPGLSMSASLGYERTQIINSDSGAAEGDFRAARADLSLGWSPTPGMTYGLRYEVIRQTGDSVTSDSIPSYLRNTLFLTFQLSYPRRTSEGVGKLGRSLRSDGPFKISPYAEPVVP